MGSAVGAMELAGNAADSPIVKRKSTPTGSLFVTYSY
ncbi:MipA/OmpV family protein [Herbaspirillum frisingense]|nr:MipA/OmpV family protein [Herbaspirillum frisingense]